MTQYEKLPWRYDQLSKGAGYGLAAVSTGLSALVRWLLPWALTPAPYLGFYPAVVVSAALGGLGPGLASTFGSLFLVNFVFGKFDIHNHGAMMRQVIWVVASVGVSILAETQRKARMRERGQVEELRRLNDELGVRVEERRQAEEEVQNSAVALRAANTRLADSRNAAINLMEDALNARRQAEEATAALRDSEEKLSLSLRSAGMGVWRLDVKDQKRFFDDQVCRCLGIDPAHFGGSAEEFLAAVHPDDRDTIKAAMERTIESGILYEVEYRAVLPDGRIRHIAARGRLTQTATGEPQRVDGLAWDITERKEAEEMLRRYELLARHSRDIILFVDSSCGRLLEVNTAAVDAYGYTREELLNLTIQDLRAEVTRELMDAQMAEAASKGARFETIHRRRDGTTFPVEVSSQGAMIGPIFTLISVVRDITDRKGAEEALRESEEQFRRAIEDAPIPVIMLAEDGQVLQISRTWTDLTGYTPESMKSFDSWLNCAYGEGADEVRSHVQDLFKGGRRTLDVELPVLTIDGRLRYWSFSASSPGMLADGRYFVVGMAVDITERKRAEEALQKAHNELAQQMEERVRELQEKEVLLKEVHHRVKNNLQVISSLVGMQESESRDETVREVLRDVIYRVRSMALVHEKLYHSESLARIDFAEYAQSLLGYLWRAHGAAAAAVELKFELESVELPVDTATPCGLILNELAGNALKHAFRGRTEGEVSVLLRAETGMVSLTVRDNGIGLPEGFDWRKASSLGLRLVQMLAGQLKAEVDVSTTAGTKFQITFMLPGEKKNAISADVL